MEELLAKIRHAIVNREVQAAPGLVDQALDSGMDLDSLVNQGLVAAMDVVGSQFASNEIFVPEMLVSAKLMSDALNKVKPLMVNQEASSRGSVLICTVKGDMHDIGKNLVTMMLEGAGFTVHDIGVDVTSEQVVKKVKELKPEVLGLSALLTTTMPEMQSVIELLTEMGIRQQIKVMIGGAPVSQEFADKIGADGYAEDAAQAVTLTRGFFN
jgi:5-methyltetrahydrofolate--homocysteine methyltransferase